MKATLNDIPDLLDEQPDETREGHDTPSVAAARRGETRAIREVITLNQADVFRLIYRQVRDRERALELTQDTFLRVCRSISSVRNSEKIRFWILRIAMNVCRSHFASRAYNEARATHSLAEKQADLPSTDPEVAAEHERAIARAIALLPRLKPEHREVVALCILDRRSYREAATILEIPIGTVGSRLNQAIHQLRELYFKDNER